MKNKNRKWLKDVKDKKNGDSSSEEVMDKKEKKDKELKWGKQKGKGPKKFFTVKNKTPKVQATTPLLIENNKPEAAIDKAMDSLDAFLSADISVGQETTVGNPAEQNAPIL